MLPLVLVSAVPELDELSLDPEDELDEDLELELDVPEALSEGKGNPLALIKDCM